MFLYRLTLDKSDHKALGFAADRYTPAELLWDGIEAETEHPDGSVTYTIQEHVMWEVHQACEVENGCGEMYPGSAVLGGTLATKLINLMQSIV